MGGKTEVHGALISGVWSKLNHPGKFIVSSSLPAGFANYVEFPKLNELGTVIHLVR